MTRKKPFRELWLKTKRFVLPAPIAFIARSLTDILFKTCKFEVEGLHHLENIPKQKCILALWHNRIIIMCEFFQRYLPKIPYTAFLSKSRDGELIARAVQSFPNGRCIRVAHNARHHALKTAIAHFNGDQEGPVLITPDGPKGPRYKIKRGLLFAALEAKAPVIAFSWTANRYWQFKTWDHFRIPKPFSTIKIRISSPIYIKDPHEILEATNLLEIELSK